MGYEIIQQKQGSASNIYEKVDNGAEGTIPVTLADGSKAWVDPASLGFVSSGDNVSVLTNDAAYTSNGENVILTALGDGDRFSSNDGTYRNPPQSGTTTMRADSGISGPPDDGKVRWNNTTQINSSQLFISEENDDGDDLQNYLSGLEVNDGIYLQNSGDAGNYQSWNITGVTDNGAYKTLDVLLLQSAGANFSTGGQGQSLLMTIQKGAGTLNGLQEAQSGIQTSPTITPVRPNDYFTFFDESTADYRTTQYKNINGNRVVINLLSDLDDFLNVDVYELPAGIYEFSGDIDFGTRRIVLTDPNTTYSFCGIALPLVSYSGVTSFITTAQTGILLELFNFFITTPNATCVDMTNNNSFIVNFVVFLNCQKAGNIDTFDFISFSAVPVIGCDDGFTADDVVSINMRFPQYNDNPDTGGCYMRVLGANSERLIASVIDARPESTECFIDIDATYGGDVAMGTGVLKTGGGTFFSASGRDQTDVDVDVQGIKNVSNTKVFAAGHVTGNATKTVISSTGVAVKINVGSTWTDVGRVRFNFNASGTWTYIGKETITKFVTIVATIDPAGGGTDDVSLYIAQNGTPIPTSKGEAAASAGSQVSAVANITLNTNDTLEAWVANESDTSNLTIKTASFDVG